MAQYTPEQYKKLLDRFATGLPKEIAKAEVVAAQQLRVDMSGRIWSARGTKDIGGGTRGYRSESWIREREFKGLQIRRVDLDFDGDLKRSIGISEVKKNVGVLISGDLNIKKYKGADKIYQQENSDPVFEASVKEEKRAVDAFSEVITDYIQKFFD